MNELTRALLDAGLLQFGEFDSPDGFRPFLTSLEMLASYPAVLRLATGVAVQALPDADYLLAAPDALALTVAMGLARDLPVVYSRGSDEPPVYDLVGAYDIGHAAVLVAGSTTGAARLERLITGARRVGLEVHTVLAVVETAPLAIADVQLRALVQLAEVARDLAAAGQIPAGQGRLVEAWVRRAEGQQAR